MTTGPLWPDPLWNAVVEGNVDLAVGLVSAVKPMSRRSALPQSSTQGKWSTDVRLNPLWWLARKGDAATLRRLLDLLPLGEPGSSAPGWGGIVDPSLIEEAHRYGHEEAARVLVEHMLRHLDGSAWGNPRVVAWAAQLGLDAREWRTRQADAVARMPEQLQWQSLWLDIMLDWIEGDGQARDGRIDRLQSNHLVDLLAAMCSLDADKVRGGWALVELEGAPKDASLPRALSLRARFTPAKQADKLFKDAASAAKEMAKEEETWTNADVAQNRNQMLISLVVDAAAAGRLATAGAIFKKLTKPVRVSRNAWPIVRGFLMAGDLAGACITAAHNRLDSARIILGRGAIVHLRAQWTTVREP